MDEQLEGVVDESQMRTSSNPPWGTVRAVVVQGEFALVLDDLNSDYREVELSIFRRVGGRWQLVLDQDDAGFPEVGEKETRRGGWFRNGAGDAGCVWTFGREQPGALVRLTCAGEVCELRADDDGWWLFVEHADIDDRPIRLT